MYGFFKKTIMNRKSSPITEPIKGNSEKYLSYREAFARIKFAQEEKFYLEAISIEESIITDRLISHLHGTNKIAIENEKDVHKKYSFHKLIELLSSEEVDESKLKTRLFTWKDDRNICLHRLAKSFPGSSTKNIDEFLNFAEKTAKTGENLVRDVLAWHKKMKTSNQ